MRKKFEIIIEKSNAKINLKYILLEIEEITNENNK